MNQEQAGNHRPGATLSLVDRLDPVLGEASAGIGALLTEFVRRTLRGGVQRVDDEMQGVVDEKVDGAVALRLPVIEQAAVTTAQQTARAVAAAEVAELERETREATQQLTNEILETERRAESKALELVTTHVEDAANRVESTARSLVSREVTALEQRASQLVSTEVASLEQRASELVATQVSTLERKATDLVATQVSTLERKATDLVAQEITGLEARAEEKARTMLNEQVELLKQKSKATIEQITTHINGLHQTARNLKKEIGDEQQLREQTARSLETALRTAFDASHAKLSQTYQAQVNEWSARWAQSEARAQALEKRLAELERPRGLAALWARLFGRKKPVAATE